MLAILNRFTRDDSGQDLVEYALLLGIITVSCVVALDNIGTKVAGMYQQVQTVLDQA